MGRRLRELSKRGRVCGVRLVRYRTIYPYISKSKTDIPTHFTSDPFVLLNFESTSLRIADMVARQRPLFAAVDA